MRAGGWFDGVMALVTLAVVVNQGFCERIVTVNVCRFVPSTGANAHVAAPDVLGSPSRSIVSVPVHVPVRNDCCPDGEVGTGVPPPHVAVRQERVNRSGSLECPVIRTLLRWRRSSAGILARGRTGQRVHRIHALTGIP